VKEKERKQLRITHCPEPLRGWTAINGDGAPVHGEDTCLGSDRLGSSPSSTM
jgi:hypothetical protein